MLRSYLTVAWRALRRNAGTTALNVIGLTAGLACCILIGLWVHDELSYDAFHPEADRTYRIVQKFNLPDLNDPFPLTPEALGPTLASRLPGVERSVRVTDRYGTVSAGERTFVEDDILFTEEGFFDVFGFEILRGTAELHRPNTVLLTPETADKYFPNSDPIGQTLTMGPRESEVTGIVEASPEQTSLPYTMIQSFDERVSEDGWSRNMYQTFVHLGADATPESVEAELAAMFKEILLPAYQDALDGKVPDDGVVFYAQPLTGIHLGTGVPIDLDSEGNATYVWIFALLAVFVLVLACINFMNLSTARSARRANEVGVRKVMGAGRKQLAGQFVGESLLMTAFAAVASIVVCAASLPAFNQLSGKSIEITDLLTVEFAGALLALVIVTGLLSGSYPAFVLSRFSPLRTLRGRSTSSEGSARLRKGLVVFQFAVTIALLAGTSVVHQQVSFLQSSGLGFEQENLVVIDRSQSGLGDQEDAFMTEISALSSVASVASGFNVPGNDMTPNTMWRSGDPGAEPRNLDYTYVSPGYAKTLGVKMEVGRGFTEGRQTDSTAVVINAKAAQSFGWSPQEALGKTVQQVGRGTPYTVIGVTENYHYESLENEIYPFMLFRQSADWHHRHVIARLKPGATQDAASIDAIHGVWSEFAEVPPETSLLADDLAAQYRAEQRLSTLFTTFAGLAILIACLGLFGLATYAAQQRTKEVGIRKALGATAAQVIGLLSKDFLVLVGLAFALGAPIAYAGMEQWLDGFAYRIDVGLGTPLVAGLAALLLAAATVSIQAYRAARTDPASALRAE